jgi:hypothetical protein
VSTSFLFKFFLAPNSFDWHYLTNLNCRKHTKYHTKPVSCPEPDCEYTCANDHDLKRHHLTNHGEVQRQKCSLEGCTITFTRRYNLLRHIRKVHGGKRNEGAEVEQKA